MQESKGSNIIETIVYTFIGCVIAAINGSIVALISSSHSWGIVSLFTLLAIAYWLYQCNKFILRQARVRNTKVAFRMTLLMMVCYLLAEVQVSALFMGTTLPGFYVSRWQSGLPLFGAGTFAIGGWLWAVVYVPKLLLLFIICYGAAADEGDRPYCTDCGTATTNLIWKQPVGRFDLDALKVFANNNHQWDLESLMTIPEPDPSGEAAILVRVWSCQCAKRYEFKAELLDLVTKIASLEIVGFLPMSAPVVSRVVQWVWSIDPEADIPENVLEIYKDNPPPSPDPQATAPHT